MPICQKTNFAIIVELKAADAPQARMCLAFAKEARETLLHSCKAEVSRSSVYMRKIERV